MKLYIRNVWVIKFLSIWIDLILSLWSETHSSVKNIQTFSNSFIFYGFSHKWRSSRLGINPGIQLAMPQIQHWTNIINEVPQAETVS